MSWLIYILSTFFLASAQLETPDAYLSRGNLSAADLHNVMLDIQLNITSLTTKDEFRKYLAIMPQIATRAEIHRLESIYPGAVQQLGEQMVSYGIRWLDLSVDEASVVQQHLEWTDAITAGQYIYVVSDLIFRKRDLDAKFLSANIDLFIAAAAKFNDEPYIERGYRDLNSEVALNELKKITSDNDEDFLFWIEKLSNQETMSAYIYSLLERSYLISISDREELDFILNACQIIKNTLLSQKIAASLRIYDALGEVVIETLDRATVYSWPLDPAQVEDVMMVLGVAQSLNMANRLSASVYNSLPEMDTQNLLIAEVLLAQLSLQGATQKAEEFANIFYGSAPAVIRTVQKNEGIYTVKNSDGTRNDWVVHFFRSGTEQFILTLNNKRSRAAVVTFYSMNYDYLTETYVFFQTSPSQAEASEQFIQAQFSKDGSGLTIWIPDAREGWTQIDAQKEQSLIPPTIYVFTGDPGVPQQLEGTATVEGESSTVSLSIAESNGIYLAQMYDSSSRRELINMQGFFSHADGYLYLTSNKKENGHLVNLKIRKDSLEQWSGTLLDTSLTQFKAVTFTAVEN
jgi:hypothetical protein